MSSKKARVIPEREQRPLRNELARIAYAAAFAQTAEERDKAQQTLRDILSDPERFHRELIAKNKLKYRNFGKRKEHQLLKKTYEDIFLRDAFVQESVMLRLDIARDIHGNAEHNGDGPTTCYDCWKCGDIARKFNAWERDFIR